MGVRVVFLDCDGTLTPVKSSWQYLHERLGLWDQNAEEFQRLYREGRIDYAEFCRRDAALWKGLQEDKVLSIIDEIPYHRGVRETAEALAADGVLTVVLSTGLSFLVEKVKSELALSLALANDLLVEGGLLTGGIRIRVEHDETVPGTAWAGGGLSEPRTKGYWVRRILRDRGIAREEAAAVGDGEGDRGMFEEAGLAIGFRPSPAVLPFLDHCLGDGSFSEVLDVLRAYG
jgi:phosphoserine phosphatase